MYVIYVLHDLRRPPGANHYIGRTTQPRFRARIQEHVRGAGAKGSRQIGLEAPLWVLADWFLTDNPATERHTQRTYKPLRSCPICSRTPGQEAANQGWTAVGK